uniref:F-box domain-containing protein n=1 Tax=Aegilops tauschii subsp. strangulata TaxID=200361 RepID=A0A453M8Q1_AEGTS
KSRPLDNLPHQSTAKKADGSRDVKKVSDDPLLDLSSMDDAAPPARDWSSLPLDALSLIFVRLGAVDILMGAGLVCRSWLEAANFPDVWRSVDMDKHESVFLKGDAVLREMAKVAVDRSGGQLRVFVGRMFVTDELIKYIMERSPSLTTLRLVSCFGVFSKQLTSVIKESPLLELRSLELENIDLTMEELTAILESCPILEVLRLHYCFLINSNDERTLRAKFTRIKTMTLKWDDECCTD